MMQALKEWWTRVTTPPPPPPPPKSPAEVEEDALFGEVKQALQRHASSSRLVERMAHRNVQDAIQMRDVLSERVRDRDILQEADDTREARKAELQRVAEEAIEKLEASLKDDTK